jgi:hypothetical protein
MVSSSINSHHMRRNALVIESLFEVLSPILNSRDVYMNIAYIKTDMIEYMDSPVPYIIGMCNKVWEKVGLEKWNQMDPEIGENLVLFKVD